MIPAPTEPDHNELTTPARKPKYLNEVHSVFTTYIYSERERKDSLSLTYSESVVAQSVAAAASFWKEARQTEQTSK
jgi:hypothetical protein